MIKNGILNGKHVLYVSSSLPTPGMGSSVIVYRHLKNLLDWRVSILAPQQQLKPAYKLPKTWKIYSLPASNELFPDGWELYLPGKAETYLKRAGLHPVFDRHPPDVILNVFGKNSILAYKIARRYNIPLAIILHDRWEIWVGNKVIEHALFKLGLSRNILKYASIVWPVSRELGEFYTIRKPEKFRLLYPIPEGLNLNRTKWKDRFKRQQTIVYAGSFRPYMRAYFQDIAAILKGLNIQLIIISKDNASLVSAFNKFDNVSFKDPLPLNQDLLKYLSRTASALLIPGSFEPNGKNSRELDFSFPSKLVEFAGLGLPLLIHAPVNASVGKWAANINWTGFTSATDIGALTQFFQMLKNKEKWLKMATESENIAKGLFNAELIQQQFDSELLGCSYSEKIRSEKFASQKTGEKSACSNVL